MISKKMNREMLGKGSRLFNRFMYDFLNDREIFLPYYRFERKERIPIENQYYYLTNRSKLNSDRF